MARWATATCATAMILLSGAGTLTARQTGDDPLIASATGYVRDYTKAMACVVCEERQTQRVVKHDGTVKKTREITSEVAFVDAGGAHAFSLVVFRDVMTVDGKPVRNREERPLVPSEMLRHEHRLRDPKSDMSVAQATYSNCRQFQVTVEETIRLPNP